MTKQGSPVLSSAIDSGEGRLEIKNDHAIIQIERVLSNQGQQISAQLREDIRNWCETEKQNNKDTHGGYSLGWKRLEKLLKNSPVLRSSFLAACDEYREYVNGVESGEIVPTPTPPASTIVTREQGTVRQGLAAIYSTTPKPPKVRG